MRITVEGKLQKGVTSKDVALYIIAQLSTSGATGFFVEYAGSVFREMSMEGRMTVCNMSIEMGARGGMVAPDEKTFDYIKGRLHTPKGADWDKAMIYWRTLYTDEGATFDKEYHFKAKDIEPMVTYGTNPGMGIGITKNIPTSKDVSEAKETFEKSLSYMGYHPQEPMIGKTIDYVFVGSCTNDVWRILGLFRNWSKGEKKPIM